MTSIIARIGAGALDILKEAGKLGEVVLITALQGIVMEAKTTPIGALAVALVGAFEHHDLTGAQKFEAVLGALEPVAPTLLAAAGLPPIATNLLSDFLRELIQSSHNDVKHAAIQAATNAALEAATVAATKLGEKVHSDIAAPVANDIAPLPDIVQDVGGETRAKGGVLDVVDKIIHI